MMPSYIAFSNWLLLGLGYYWASLAAQTVKKNSACIVETWVRSLGWEEPLEKEMDTHSSIVAWRIPWIKILLIPYKIVSCNPAGN